MIRNFGLKTRILGVLSILFLFLTIFAATAAQAKNPYEMHRDAEGDPGDGVLEPSAPATGEPDEMGLQLPLSGSLLTTGFDREFCVPMLIFVGSEPIPTFVWIPAQVFIPGHRDWPSPDFGLRTGRGW